MDENLHTSFRTTRWSVVREAAGCLSSADAKIAMAELCEIYWPPLYAYLRRQGLSPHDSEDTVQGFFGRLLQRDDFGGLSPEFGRFRAFLLVSLKNYLNNQRDHARTMKRGGSVRTFSFATPQIEQAMASGYAHKMTADRIYERQWALTLLETTRIELLHEQVGDRRTLYEVLIVYLTGEQATTYAEVAAKLRTTEASIKMTVSRMRKRYRELLRSQIAQTVSAPQEIEEEIRYLISVLQSDTVVAIVAKHESQTGDQFGGF